MIVNLKNLKSVLKTKISEYEMLNKSLLEMIEKNSTKDALDLIRKEINETQNYINNLQSDIEVMTKQENDTKNEAKKSFYNEIKKPTLARSIKMKTAKDGLNKCNANFYDSIKKSDFAPYDTPYNSIKKEEDKPKKQYPSIQPYNDVMFSNRFLVRFDNDVKLPEWYVRKVNFYLVGKELDISICDCLIERDGKKRPIITEFTNLFAPFRISIDHLDPTGVVLYTERYHGCKVIEIIKGGLDYANDDMATIDLRIMYSDVTYETAH